MASSIDASTSGAGGVITTADNTGILNLKTAGTNAVTIDATQNVGIGTTTPTAAKLHLYGSGTDCNQRIEAPTGNRFVDVGTGNTGHYLYGYGSYPLYFGVNGVERMRIDSSGNFTSVISSGSTSYPAYWCRAWVNFNGVGTIAIRASGNVTSLTDNGVGNYTVNLSTATPDTNGALLVGNSFDTSISTQNSVIVAYQSSTTAIPVSTYNNVNGTRHDATYISVGLMR